MSAISSNAARSAAALALSVALALAPGASRAEGFLRVQGRQIVDAQGRPVILRGVGLGGWMLQEGYMLGLTGPGMQHAIRRRVVDLIGEEDAEAFYRAWLDNYVGKDDIDAIAAWGFNSVRLPMHYELYTLPLAKEPVPGQQTWLEDGFRRTDALISWAKANGLYVILDLHAAPGGQGNDLNISDRDPSAPSLWDEPANRDKMVALWRRLAQRYRDEPAVAGYDLINEPNWGFADAGDRNGCRETGNAPLRELLVRTTAAIREVDRRHIVIVEGNCWGNNYRGVLDAGLWDDNLVLSFHKYWTGTGRDSIAEPLALRERWNLPLWLGETGENSNDWFARTVETLEREGIGWANWPLKKLRYNNPLQVVANPGYKRVLAYWEGQGPRPSRAQAREALLTLASRDVRFEHNLRRADVVDAWLRAPRDDRSLPFKPHRIGRGGGEVAAVDFDLGRNGVAYFDLDAGNESGKPNADWNRSQLYRNDGVDIERDGDGLRVASMQAGEWLKYTIEAEAAGDYRLSWRGTPGRLRIRVNGAALAPAPANRPQRAALLRGRNTLVVESVSGAPGLAALRFEPVAATAAGAVR
ncbi:cellulase family glycosylhydrolase [Lysobacter sp. BMK333-48F3]|uniref:cellulase family glycosylhydrolase n=1 Tax=Lysobacter sp. BMK333-48F3 TaxID=2867962 RepID=UPI001C8BE8E6|nr:cellulase family glycosylhydrolase [Lysobacter sp. BMK333-48F3]MBX9404057.1 cellulase family glycosylhydrolase [Lysobacter sp. BMK333-48F3]